VSTPVAAVEPAQPGASEVAAEYQHSELFGPPGLLKTTDSTTYHKILLLIWWSPSAIHLTIVNGLRPVQYRLLLCLSKQNQDA